MRSNGMKSDKSFLICGIKVPCFRVASYLVFFRQVMTAVFVRGALTTRERQAKIEGN